MPKSPGYISLEAVLLFNTKEIISDEDKRSAVRQLNRERSPQRREVLMQRIMAYHQQKRIIRRCQRLLAKMVLTAAVPFSDFVGLLEVFAE
jgi:hypothetical protein